MFFVCENQGPRWYKCLGILENGFCFGSHICSHPAFAPGDLYFTREKRQQALNKLFNITVESAKENNETIIVKYTEDIPDWMKSMNLLQEGLKSKYQEYEDLIGDTNAEVKATGEIL